MMGDLKWDLSRLDNGELSALRRSAGMSISKASMTALRAFYKACGYCDPRFEEAWFPAVCMEALWRYGDGITVRCMEECLRYLKKADEKTTQSLQHRIDMLLETPRDMNGYLLGKLLNLVKIIKSKTNLKPDFQVLAKDIYHWNDENRRVQRRWLSTLYNNKPEENDEEEE